MKIKKPRVIKLDFELEPTKVRPKPNLFKKKVKATIREKVKPFFRPKIKHPVFCKIEKLREDCDYSVPTYTRATGAKYKVFAGTELVHNNKKIKFLRLVPTEGKMRSTVLANHEESGWILVRLPSGHEVSIQPLNRFVYGDESVYALNRTMGWK